MSVETTNITTAGKYLVLIAFAVWMLSYNLWWVFDNYAIYDLGVAITIFLLILSIHLSAEGKYRLFSLGFTCIAGSNVIDELFFDPTIIDINEYISAFIIMFSVIWIYLRNANR